MFVVFVARQIECEFEPGPGKYFPPSTADSGFLKRKDRFLYSNLSPDLLSYPGTIFYLKGNNGLFVNVYRQPPLTLTL